MGENINEQKMKKESFQIKKKRRRDKNYLGESKKS